MFRPPPRISHTMVAMSRRAAGSAPTTREARRNCGIVPKRMASIVYSGVTGCDASGVAVMMAISRTATCERRMGTGSSSLSPTMTSSVIPRRAQCCIAGGGPAGMMLGFLLARAGVEVLVLERHADFLRDFRGDTIHPSTLEVMYELGLLDRFLERPHSELREIGGRIGREVVMLADFSGLPTRCKFLA